MSSRCAPALHYKVSGIGRKRLPHHNACPTMCTRVGQTLSSVNRERFLNYGKRTTVKFFSVTVSPDCTVLAWKSTVTPAV